LPPPSRRPIVVMNEVVFKYDVNFSRETTFTLGPINLDIRSGEVIFVIGGNGSGKSTFVKVLTGLYEPGTGTISFAGTLIPNAHREWYREHFAAVFSDFYLFDKLLGLDDAIVESSAKSYLNRLKIDHKVTVKDGIFSTTDLSQGQRKRLALLTAYL